MPGTLFLASSNAGKLAEFLALAGTAMLSKPSPQIALLPGIASLPGFAENAPTFAENATGKALHYSKFADGLVFADDSGLVVPALGGAPGVLSARYAGPNASSEERNAKLLAEMQGLSGDQRHAYFVCAIALAEEGRAIAIVSARADGAIMESPCGARGFGYDPVFYVRESRKTFAELTSDEKNALSHRGKAFRRLLEVLGS
jgi:XTP/dITP diphosphohydrolase